MTPAQVQRKYAWPDILTQLIHGDDIGRSGAAWAMGEIMSGQTSPATLGAFLVGLATKGESVGELRSLADTMLTFAEQADISGPCVDIVGTGGDRAHTVNISTMAAVTIAACGIPVAKHGNRASSSSSGSADVLEALGVRLDLSQAAVAQTFRECGITFFFANVFHPSMRFAAPTRRELGVGTAFNVLGPLTNPARPKASAIGVASDRHAPLVAGVLADRGSSAVVFRGTNGLDELTTSAPNEIWWVCDGAIATTTCDLRDLGVPHSSIADLRGGEAAHNAEVAERVLSGRDDSIISDTVALNAAAGLLAFAGHPVADGPVAAEEFTTALKPYYEQARRALDEAKPAALLQQWAEVTQRLAGV